MYEAVGGPRRFPGTDPDLALELGKSLARGVDGLLGTLAGVLDPLAGLAGGSLQQRLGIIDHDPEIIHELC